MLYLLYPALALLLMFVMGTIVVMLKYGPRLFGVRHNTLTNQYDWEDQVYEQKDVSYA